MFNSGFDCTEIRVDLAFLSTRCAIWSHTSIGVKWTWMFPSTQQILPNSHLPNKKQSQIQVKPTWDSEQIGHPDLVYIAFMLHQRKSRIALEIIVMSVTGLKITEFLITGPRYPLVPSSPRPVGWPTWATRASSTLWCRAWRRRARSPPSSSATAAREPPSGCQPSRDDIQCCCDIHDIDVRFVVTDTCGYSRVCTMSLTDEIGKFLRSHRWQPVKLLVYNLTSRKPSLPLLSLQVGSLVITHYELLIIICQI